MQIADLGRVEIVTCFVSFGFPSLTGKDSKSNKKWKYSLWDDRFVVLGIKWEKLEIAESSGFFTYSQQDLFITG